MTEMLLEWVFTSVFLILVVLALRAALGRRMSARMRYALWAVVLARLLVPVQLFTSPLAGTRVFSEYETTRAVTAVAAPLSSYGPDEDTLTAPGGQPGSAAAQITAPQAPDPPAAPDPPKPPDWNSLPGWVGYLGWTWLLGSAAVALALLASNLRFFRKLRRERTPLDEANLPLRAYVAVDLPSPCLFGVVRPAIYATPEAAADPDMLRHVLAHEYTHYRHGDHLWSLLRCAALAVHWWNPLVWAAAVLSRRDAELACDEGALERLGDGERAGYGGTLLALVTAKPRPGDLLRCATTMSGDKKSLKERVSRIARAPRRVLWAAAAAVVVTVLACVCAFGQAEEEKAPEDGPEPSPTATQDMAGTNTDYRNLTADLTFSMSDAADEEEEPYVKINGSVDGVELTRGAFWDPGLDQGDLSMMYPPFTDGIEGHVAARWSDKARTSVTLSTRMTAMFSSASDVGFWVFTVDLEKDGGVVTEMTAMPAMPAQTSSDTELRLYPRSITDEEAVKAARVAAKLLIAAENYYYSHNSSIPDSQWQADLNRNGVPETIRTYGIYDGQGTRLEVWEDGRLLWSDVGAYAHAGWNAVFLCTLDGEDYLLRYSPTMYQGNCNYAYQLLTLSESGEEQVARENSVQFDINFSPLLHTGFDPEAIAALVDEVNGLLAHSVQLMNTDQNLLDTFEKEGRLFDSVWWLDISDEVFTRDEGKSLLENLRDFQRTMETLENKLPFPSDEPMELWFGSGAGAWRTLLTLHPDGSFEGDFSDSDMGDNGEGYPSGTQYVCRFHGRFGNFKPATYDSWSMTLEELVIDTGRPIGEEWTEGGVRYISSSPYGMDGKDGGLLEPGAEFVFYTPDAQGYAPGSELYGMADESSELYEFWTWWPDKHAFSAEQSGLGCYALRNVESGYGFFDLQSWGIE